MFAMKMFNTKKLWKAVSLGLCGVALTVMLAGCGADNSSSADKGVLKVGVTNFADTLEPTQNFFGWVVMRYGLGECLTKFDEKMNVQPWLAESWSISDDHMTWTFKIREGVKFSNGNPLTAEAVKASIERAFAKNNRAATFFKYKEIKAEGQVLTIVTEKPMPNMPGFLADPLFIIVDTSAEGSRDFAKEGPICTGPYMVESFVKEKAVMKKNPNYWDGEVPYDKVEIIFMGDASAKANALKAGDVDLVENITNVSDIQTLQADDSFTVDIASGVRCGFAWMNFNGVLGNETLRQAIQMAVDHDTICASNTIGGLYTAGYSVLPSTLAYGYENLENPYPYDPDAANKLLDDAGIVDTDGDGIRELDGQNINLRCVSYENRLLNDFSDAYALYLAEIGIGVTADYGSSDDQWSKLVAGQYDFNNNNWTTVGNGDPTEYMANWYSKAEANYCGYASDEYDALYEELLSEFDPEKRAELLQIGRAHV